MAATTQWVCVSCSCHNPPSLARCTVCNSVKPAEFPRLVAGGPRLKNFHSGAGGSAQFVAGVSSDMIIDPDNAFSRCRPTLVPSSSQKQREGGGRGDHSTSGVGGSNGAQSKWICSGCTYSNWPNSKHCTMCNALRRHHKLSSPQIGTGGKDSGRVGSGSDAGVGYGESILDYVPRRLDHAPSSHGAVGGGGVHEDIRVPSSQVVRDSPSNRPSKLKMGKKSSADNRGGQKKWKCFKCTYENWVRAGKCIMCQAARNKTPSPPMSDSESSQSPNLTTKQGHYHHHHHHHRSSPSPSFSSSSPTENANSGPAVASLLHTRSLGINSNQATPSPSHADTISPSSSAVHLIPCTATDNASSSSSGSEEILYSPSTVILTSTSNEARQIRNRLSSSDWLFINACLGVVNEDVPAVKAYLRLEGDRARQLTRDECVVLGQPSIFSVGSTLVHLAIR